MSLFFCGSPVSAAEVASQILHIREVHLNGLNRSDPAWFLDYTSLDCPCTFSKEQLEQIRQKILTTQVFQDAQFELIPVPEQAEHFDLELQLIEKWTMIPVIRGVFGGGTPLLVAGIYDTHALGRLLTLGAESRTYGSAPTGGVIWFRAPRWLGGHHYLNLELWQDNRIRSVYDRGEREAGRIYGSALAGLAEYLHPLGQNLGSPWQLGLRIQLRQQKILRWYEEPNSIAEKDSFDLLARNQKRLLARLVYDDMAVLQQNLQGLRVLLSAGPTWSGGLEQRSWEEELFWYQIWGQDWNLSFHQWIGLSDDRSYQGCYFLGGFDSIRGLPDGLLYGNKAAYTNLELRKIFYRGTYAWLQAASYLDYGAAGFSASQWFEQDRATWGIGLRIAAPRVNRLVLRVDYAWSLDRPHTSSISVGMNQFIDPYRPL